MGEFMSYKKILLLSLFGLIPAQACQGGYEPPVERYSPWVNWVMDKLSASSSLQNYARQKRALGAQETDASIHADLFKKAQEEIGIAQEDILPVIDISIKNNPEMPMHGIACTSSNKIQVISENFDHCPYGAQRIVALHEAFHNKYHDASFEQWIIQQLSMATMGNIGLTTAGLLRLNYKYVSAKGLRVAGYVGSPLVAIAANMVGMGLGIYKSGLLQKPLNSYERFKEYRADRDAVEHASCYKCVRELAQVAGDSLPYLQQHELKAYAQSFEKEHKICSVHSQQD